MYTLFSFPKLLQLRKLHVEAAGRVVPLLNFIRYLPSACVTRLHEYMEGEEYYIKANKLFVEENFDEALEMYLLGIESNPSDYQCHSGASQVLLKQNKYEDALDHANQALENNPESSSAHLRKGMALFYMSVIEEAKKSFEDGLKFKDGDAKLLEWLSKCDDLIEQDKAAKEFMCRPCRKMKYDWYQSETHVVVTALIKNVKPDQLKYDIQEKYFELDIDNPTEKSSLQLHLTHEVDPSQCQIKVLSTKIEIKLKKVEGIRWDKLECDKEREKMKTVGSTEQAGDSVIRYPSSSHYNKDWNKLELEIKEEEKAEKLEGDAALNHLFQQIYSDGSDEVKKAMQKSFVESGGTVLSTNWNEISQKKVEVKPPDGMEFKKWQI